MTFSIADKDRRISAFTFSFDNENEEVFVYISNSLDMIYEKKTFDTFNKL